MKNEQKSQSKLSPTPPANQFAVLQSILRMGPSQDDPQGMYTGKPIEPGEVPVQDNDDL